MGVTTFRKSLYARVHYIGIPTAHIIIYRWILYYIHMERWKNRRHLHQFKIKIITILILWSPCSVYLYDFFWRTLKYIEKSKYWKILKYDLVISLWYRSTNRIPCLKLYDFVLYRRPLYIIKSSDSDHRQKSLFLKIVEVVDSYTHNIILGLGCLWPYKF